MATTPRPPRSAPLPCAPAALPPDPDTATTSSPTFTITALAREFDLTPRAIRFYEDMGLLEPTRLGRKRVYSHRDRTRLKLTLRGKRLGLSLGEVKQLVDMYESGADDRPQLQAFMGVLSEHRRQLEQQLDDIRVTLGEIEQHEARCRALLIKAGGPASAPARSRTGRRTPD